jgi:hypothetical protein
MEAIFKECSGYIIGLLIGIIIILLYKSWKRKHEKSKVNPIIGKPIGEPKVVRDENGNYSVYVDARLERDKLQGLGFIEIGDISPPHKEGAIPAKFTNQKEKKCRNNSL